MLCTNHMLVEATAEISPEQHIIRMRPKWKLEEGDWTRYEEEMKHKTRWDTPATVEGLAREVFSDIMLSDRNNFQQTTGIVNTKHSKTWWSKQCDNAVRARKDVIKRMRRRPCPITTSIYRSARAKARYVLEE